MTSILKIKLQKNNFQKLYKRYYLKISESGLVENPYKTTRLSQRPLYVIK